MGTYTTNKELYKPSVGETGWGTLVNGNFETIDTFLKPISLLGSTYTFTGNQTGGSISATSITNSGTLTNNGKITANGGIGTTSLTATTGTFSGTVTGANFNGVPLKSSGVYTVTPTSYICYPRRYMMILPYRGGTLYSGRITVYNTAAGDSSFVYHAGGADNIAVTIPGNGSNTVSFSNIPFMQYQTSLVTLEMSGYTLS